MVVSNAGVADVSVSNTDIASVQVSDVKASDLQALGAYSTGRIATVAPFAKRPFHALSKPIGPLCNLDCAYCFYLDKSDYYPGQNVLICRMLCSKRT